MTGASRGLGAEIAVALAAQGALVCLLARSAEALEEVAARIGDGAVMVAADVSDPASVAHAFAAIAERHQHIDLLVNNAGAGGPTTLEELTDEQLHAEVGVNFFAPLYCTRSALPLLRAAGGGDVINISSVAVLNPYPTMWLYSAAKAALELASAGLVEELRPDGIRVSVLRVGSIAGTSFQDGWNEERTQRAFELARAEGRERFAGGAPIEPALLASWVVELATLPAHARVGLIDVRPS